MTVMAPSPYRFKAAPTQQHSQLNRDHENLTWSAFPTKPGPFAHSKQLPAIPTHSRSSDTLPLKEHGSQRFKRPGFDRVQGGREAGNNNVVPLGGSLARSLSGAGARLVVRRDEPVGLSTGESGQSRGVRNVNETADPDEDMLDLSPPRIRPNPSTQHLLQSQTTTHNPAHHHESITSPRHKRARLDLDSPPQNHYQAPQTPIRPRFRPSTQQSTPHFHVAPTFTLTPTTFASSPRPFATVSQSRAAFTSSALTTTTTDTQQLNQQPPHRRFILPPSHSTTTDAGTERGGIVGAGPPPILLPDAFSPHRRKERFVPGGWAAQVRGWIVELSGDGVSNSFEGEGIAGLFGRSSSAGPGADNTAIVRIAGAAASSQGAAGGGPGDLALIRATPVQHPRPQSPPPHHRGDHNRTTYGTADDHDYDQVQGIDSDNEATPTTHHMALIGNPTSTTNTLATSRWSHNARSLLATTGVGNGSGGIAMAQQGLAEGGFVSVRGPVWRITLKVDTSDSRGDEVGRVVEGEEREGKEGIVREKGSGMRTWVVCPVWGFG